MKRLLSQTILKETNTSVLLKRALFTPVFLSLLLAMLSLGYSAQAHATTTPLALNPAQPSYDLDQHFQYLEDKSGELDLMSLKALPEGAWKKKPGNHFSFGFTDSAFWFRGTLETLEQQSWLLEIDAPLLDEITLYLISGDKVLQHTHTGDSYPFLERPMKFREFILPLNLPPSGQATLYLRVKSSGSVQIPLNLWQDQEFYARDEMETAAIGIYFGAIMVMVLYNLFLYFRVYEASFIYYVLYVLMFAFFVVDLSGWGYKYLWPQSAGFQQYGLAIFIITGNIFVCRFIHYFLNLPLTSPKIGRLFNAVQLVFLALLCLLPFFPYNLVVQLALVMTITTAVMAQYSGVILWHRGEISARYFTVAWSAFLIVVILASLEKFALLPHMYWAEAFLPAGMALELILLSLALGERINSEKQQRIQAQLQVIALQEKNQAELEEQVTQRTLELAEANEKLHQLAITDGLTGVFNRRHFLQQGLHAIQLAKRYQRPIALIMLDIDYFKSVNDSYGHAAGDEVLRQVVAVCKKTSRETDVISRLGGEEFGILLLETTADAAHEVAERLRHEIESLSTNHEGRAISVTASLGVCTTIHIPQSLTIEQMLKVADTALYQAKESGRNRVIISPFPE